MFQDTSLIVEINQASYGGSSKKAKCSTWTFEPTHNPSFITWRVAYLLKVCEIIVISIKRWCSKEWYTTTLAMKLKKLRKNKNWLQIYDIKHHKECYCPLENTKLFGLVVPLGLLNCTLGRGAMTAHVNPFFFLKKRKEKENTECHYIFLVMLLSIIKNTDYHYPLHCHLNCSPFIYIKICKIIVSYISQGQKFSKYIICIKKICYIVVKTIRHI